VHACACSNHKIWLLNMNIFVTCDGSMGMKYWTFITVSYF